MGHKARKLFLALMEAMLVDLKFTPIKSNKYVCSKVTEYGEIRVGYSADGNTFNIDVFFVSSDIDASCLYAYVQPNGKRHFHGKDMTQVLDDFKVLCCHCRRKDLSKNAGYGCILDADIRKDGLYLRWVSPFYLTSSQIEGDADLFTFSTDKSLLDDDVIFDTLLDILSIEQGRQMFGQNEVYHDVLLYKKSPFEWRYFRLSDGVKDNRDFFHTFWQQDDIVLPEIN